VLWAGFISPYVVLHITSLFEINLYFPFGFGAGGRGGLLVAGPPG